DGSAVQLLRDTGVESHVLEMGGKVLKARKDSLKALAILHPGRFLGLLAYSRKVARFAKERKVQIIHTNSLKAHVYGGLAGWIAGIPVVWHIRDFIDRSYLPQAAVVCIRTLARFIPSYVIAVSNSVMEKLHLGGGKKVSPVRQTGERPSVKPGTLTSLVVHDGLSDGELLDRDEAEFSKRWPEPVRIGIVGRLAPWKGQHVFLQAAAALLKAGYRVRFKIVGAPLFGEDDYERELHELVKSLGISDQVEFMGFQSNIPAVLRDLEVLVHASTSADPCPNTILEGMAAGLPVVGSDGGGVPELIVDGETGLLVQMGDSQSLTSALKSLLDDPLRARRMGHAGYLRVRRDFTAARVARQVEGVYREMIPSDTPPAYAPPNSRPPSEHQIADARGVELGGLGVVHQNGGQLG
ncbi:MAG: glycosyltransferase family 4 protein, partial [Verrucomicrobiales bacterium]